MPNICCPGSPSARRGNQNHWCLLKEISATPLLHLSPPAPVAPKELNAPKVIEVIEIPPNAPEAPKVLEMRELPPPPQPVKIKNIAAKYLLHTKQCRWKWYFT